LEPQSAAKKEIDVNAGPFATFFDCNQHWFRKSKLIAIIGSENLMPGFPECAAQARKHSVAFGDFARRIKAAAGMY
jgi:hypothetical protein